MNIKALYATVFAICALSAPAKAERFELKPYIGVDLQQNMTDYKSAVVPGVGNVEGNDLFEDKLIGANIHAGIRPHENIGLELGFFKTQEGEQDFFIGVTPANSELSLQGFTLDAIGYLPLGAGFDLIGSAGIIHTKADLKINTILGPDKLSESELEWRIGAGAQYQINDSLSTRAMIRYQPSDFTLYGYSVTDDIWTLSFGLNYHFN